MGMLSEGDCEPLEEHLLVCSKCQDLLAEADEYIRVIRAGLRAMPAEGQNEPDELDTQSGIRKQVGVSAVLAGAFSLVWLQ